MTAPLLCKTRIRRSPSLFICFWLFEVVWPWLVCIQCIVVFSSIGKFLCWGKPLKKIRNFGTLPKKGGKESGVHLNPNYENILEFAYREKGWKKSRIFLKVPLTWFSVPTCERCQRWAKNKLIKESVLLDQITTVRKSLHQLLACF